MPVATLLPSNPFTDDFSGSLADPPWTTYAPGGSTVAITSGKLRITAPLGSDWTWDTGDQLAPYALLSLFPQTGATPDEVAQGDFYLTFKINTLTPDSGTGKAAGGIALVNADDPGTMQPIIEFGSSGGAAATRGYHSWGTSKAIGTVLDVAHGMTAPFYVRLIRADNVVWAEISQDNETWVNLSDESATGRYRREIVDPLAPHMDYNSVAFFCRNEGASGPGMLMEIDDVSVTVWPRYANPPALQDLRAVTWPGGNRIDLSWTLPSTGEDEVRSMSIFRHRLHHTEFRPIEEHPEPEAAGYVPGAYGEKLYEGVPVSEYSDTDVLDDRFYYYSIFTSRVPIGDLFDGDGVLVTHYDSQPGDTDWGPQVHPANKVTGLSISDYQAADGDYFYNLFPEKYRLEDQQAKEDLGAAEGYLEKYARFLQRCVDTYRGQLSGMIKSNDPEQAALGMYGSAKNQNSIYDAKLLDLRLIDLVPVFEGLAKRRMLRFGADVMTRKGRLTALCEWVELLTGWQDCECSEPGMEDNNRYLRTWDGYDSIDTYESDALVWTAGQVTGFVGLTVNKYVGWYLEDFFGRRYKIASNTATTIIFEDTTFVGANELTFTADVTGSGDELDGIVWPAAFAGSDPDDSPNDDSYEGGTDIAQIAGDNSGLVTADILVTDFGAPSAHMEVTPSVFANGAAQDFAVALSFAGATFAARVPTTRVKIFGPNFSFLYNNRPNKDTLSWFHYLWKDALTAGSVETDALIVPPEGALRATCEVVADIGEDFISVADGPTFPTIRPGDYINPNRHQGQWFQIKAIDDDDGFGNTRYWVRHVYDVTPEDVADIGDVGPIASRATFERDQLVRGMGPRAIPWDSRIFLYEDCDATEVETGGFPLVSFNTEDRTITTSELDNIELLPIMDFNDIGATRVTIYVWGEIANLAALKTVTIRVHTSVNEALRSYSDPTIFEATVTADGMFTVSADVDPIPDSTKQLWWLTLQTDDGTNCNVRGLVWIVEVKT